MLVGEIGMPRREFLYEIQFWEVRRIIKGYRKRDKLKHQLMAECVFAATFAFRDPKGQTVKDLFPSLFQQNDEEDEIIISEERERQLQAEMAALSAQYAKEKAEE